MSLSNRCECFSHNEFYLLLNLLKDKTKVNHFLEEKSNLVGSLDWLYFLRLTRYHKVVPQIYQSLKQLNSVAVPSKVLSGLRKKSFAFVLDNTYHFNELIEIKSLFHSHNIHFIPFKGPIIAQQAYGNIYGRQYCDLDILVSEKDFDSALDLLIKTDYISPYLRNSWQQSIVMRGIISFHRLQMAHELPLGRKKNGKKLYIDLHKKISRYCYLPYDEIFSRLRPLTLQGKQIKTLSIEDSLVMMCVHGSQDGWCKLQNVYDLTSLIKKNDQLDWEAVIQRSGKANCLRRVLIGLSLAELCFDVQLPGNIRNLIENDNVLLKARYKVIKNFEHNPCEKKSFILKIRMLKLKLEMLDVVDDRIAYIRDFVWFYIFAKFHRRTIPDHDFMK